MMPFRGLFFIAIGLLGSDAVAAESTAPAAKKAPVQEKTLAPVQVIVRPLNAAADIDPKESTSPVRVIERDTFEHRITTLADTLADQAGVQIRQSGGLGSAATISIRGASGKQVHVFLDGMLLNDPLYGGVDLALFSLHDINRIQIYPGNPPARLAQAGPGGVILMESLGRETHPQTRINLGTGSFGSERQGLFNSGARGRMHYWLSANRQAADNDFRYPNHSDWYNPNDGRHTRRRNADTEQYDASASMGYELNPARQLSALVQTTTREQGVPSIQNWHSNRARLKTRAHRAQIHLRDMSSFAGRLHRSHRLSVAHLEERYHDRAGLVGLGRYDTGTDTAQLSFSNTASWIHQHHVMTGALELSYYDQQQRNRLSHQRAVQRERWLLASALSHEWASSSTRWRTQAVLRRTDLIDEADEALPDGSAAGTRQHDSFSGWQLGLRYQLFTPLELYANVSRQVRIPSLLEQFGQQGLFVGNRNLRAEEAFNTEIGARLALPGGYLEATAFRRDLDPAIITVFDARGVGRHVNVAAEFEGAELAIHYALTPRWSLAGNATWQHSENVSRTIYTYIGKQVPGIYHRTAMLRSAWHGQHWQFDLTWHIDDEMFYDAANILPAETRRTADATLSWTHSWQLGHETRLAISVRNLADHHYQDFNRFPGTGRAWFLTLQHTL